MSPGAIVHVSPWLRTKTITIAAPARLTSQKPALGRSDATTHAAAVVASGMMPSTTPPCAAGTVVIASAISTGKPTAEHSAAAIRRPHSARGGSGRRRSSSSARPAQPAIVVRAAVRNSGSIEPTASRVAGSVPANSRTPAQPSAIPSLSPGIAMSGTDQPDANDGSQPALAHVRCSNSHRSTIDAGAGLEPVRKSPTRAALSPPCSGGHIRGMAKSPGKPPQKRDPAKHSKKDPARPTRAKAARPDLVADRAGAGATAQSGDRPGYGRARVRRPGCKPPPDNSFDRRRDFSEAHRARKSTQGFGEAPQSGYVAKTPVSPGELDPDLARALGIDGRQAKTTRAPPTQRQVSPLPSPLRGGVGGGDPADDARARDQQLPPSPTPPPQGGREQTGRAARESRADGTRRTQVVPRHHRFVGHRIRAGIIAARGPAGIRRAGRAKIWTPHRPPRPEKSEGGKRSSSSPTSSPRATSRTAIRDLVEGVKRHDRTQVLLGVTGSGKTFTMAKVIEETQRPALILAPNKTLAAQLYGEFKSFFPDNAVEYFVSYYDYYQPEAYVPRTDTYIEKESSINEQIDRMRHSATRALLERDDVIIVASVSCIYGIGSVETYSAMTFALKRGERINQRQLHRRPGGAAIQAHRRRFLPRLVPGARRHHRHLPGALRGPRLARVLFGDEVESIDEFDPLTGQKTDELEFVKIYANSHYVTPRPTLIQAIAGHQAGAEVAARPAQRRRPPAGSAAARAAHHLRPRNDGGDRKLRRHRELFALSHRPPARRAAADAVRIRARQRAGVRRREPRHHPAARRHVSRRLPAQGDARRIRLPPALLHGQPAAAVRGMGRDAAADRGGVGDAGRAGRSTRPAACSPSR